MPRKRHKPEEIVAKLRRVDVLVSQGQSVADAVRGIGVTEVTYYRWRQEFGGLKTDQGNRPVRTAFRLGATLLHGGFARRVLTSRRLRLCYSSEYRTPELVHSVEGLDGNCNFSRTTGIVA